MRKWTLQKEVLVHIIFASFILVPFAFLRIYPYTTFIVEFILGGILGTFLPDIDHLIYVLYLRPTELTSQRVKAKIKDKKYMDAASLLFLTVDERTGPIFHTIFFQCLFVVFAFLVTTSSGSLLGRAIVVGFLASLLLDQILDLFFKRDISNWQKNLPFTLTRQQFKQYVAVQALILLLISYLF